MATGDVNSSAPASLLNDNDNLVLRLTHKYQDTFLLGHILSEGAVLFTYVHDWFTDWLID